MTKKEILETTANGIMIGVQGNKYHTNVYDTKSNDFNYSHLMSSAHLAYDKCVKRVKEWLEENSHKYRDEVTDSFRDMDMINDLVKVLNE